MARNNKRLLIVTQKVDRNDPVLGFFHRWLVEFSRHFESVIVICLAKGQTDLPTNVRVFSLGKESAPSGKRSLRRRLGYLFRFWHLIWRERSSYDSVFVHMNQIYVILGGLFWKLWNKKIGLWYTHRSAPISLKIAEKMAEEIFTAAPESFTVKTDKLHILGHGIDVERFAGIGGDLGRGSEKSLDGTLRILSVGRITRIKNLDILVGAVGLLKERGVLVRSEIIGPEVTDEDRLCKKGLVGLIDRLGLKDEVAILPAVSNEQIAEYYRHSDFSLNLTPTGGIDKSVLESMAAGCIPLVSNEAFRLVFGSYAPRLVFGFRDQLDLADKIRNLRGSPDLPAVRSFLLNKVRSDFGVEKIVGRIVEIMVR